ncbi:MAG TPA: ComEC/Rec2 family competence protein [Anaerolineae bacterium]|nr:ComEC/Rec2 family competence protein [Anaerolineae bacterium]HQJ11221.1 ComEC/Rec2 family competence protein [Anaerolineae bacterium]
MTPLVIFVLAWAGGELLAQAAHFPLVWLLPALPIALVLLLGWREQPAARCAAIILCGLLLGAGRLACAQPHIDAGHIAFYNNAGRVALEGVVVREPDRRPTLTNLHVDVKTLIVATGERIPLRGRVLVKAPAYNTIAYGDLIRVTGRLETPPTFESFSYRDYLARQGIHSLLRQADIEILASHQGFFLWEWLYRYKAHALNTLLTLLPEPQASLLAGILLGVESGIPDDLNAAFVATGTSHIVAISGFNLTIVAGAFVQMAAWLLKGRGKTLLPLVGLWLYTILVGASAAVLRAAVMATVAILARREKRATHGPTSLAAAVWVMTLINPYVLWDVGFQLSLAATLGLIFYTRPVSKGFEWLFAHFTPLERAQQIIKGKWLSDALIVTIAAQITTTGVIIGVFHRLSLVTLLTNFFVLPAQQYLMAAGAAALLAGLILRPIGQLLGWLAWVFLTYTIGVVRLTATFPLASVELGNITLPFVWGYYLVLGLLTWWFSRSQDERQRLIRAFKTASEWYKVGALSAVVLLMVYLYVAPDGRLHVFILDVGQGDAILIQTPGGKQILIDGGADARQTLAQLGRRMPFWDRSLDMVILTSPDADRLTGLVPVLERYKVAGVYTGPETGHGNVYTQWEALLAARPSQSVERLWAGTAREPETGVTLHALWPTQGESGPLVLRLTYDNTSFTFGGDASALVEETLVARYGSTLHSNVLILARHGAKTASTTVFLQAVAPEIVIISAGESAPAPAVLARLMGTPIYSTDQDGAVEIVSDGQRLQVTAGRR